MVITGKKFLKAIKNEDIIIYPFNKSKLGPNSYDVHLGDTLATYNDPVLDVKSKHEVTYFKIPDTGFYMQPNTLYLGSIVEYIHSKRYLPWLDGRSSLARLGVLIHYTAGRGDVGYAGWLTLEMSCVQPIKIYPNMPVGQITFFRTSKPLIKYNERSISKYNSTSKLPQPSKMYENFIIKKSCYDDLEDESTITLKNFINQ